MNIEIRQFNGPYDWGWVQKHVPLLRVQDTCGIVAVNTDTDTTVGAAIFDNFLYNSAQVSFISTTPMLHRHGFILEALNFALDACNKQYLYSFIREDNFKAIRLNKHVGFKEKMRIKEGFAKGCDFIVLELNRDDCPIFQQQFQQEAG
jgi:RimJ/RimL family protein N-acetyltransferase